MKQLCILFFAMLLSASLAAQYDICFHIQGYQKGYSTLGYYFNGRTFAIDSTLVDSTSSVVRFQGAKTLKNGVYFMFVRGIGVCDFIVNQAAGRECVLSFTTHIKGVADSMRIENDAENKSFLEYTKIMRLQRQQIEQNNQILQMIRRATKDRTATADIEKRNQQIYKGMNEYTYNTAQKNTNTFFAKMLQTQQIAQVPANIPPHFGNGAINPAYLTYIRYHFWDNFDFRDERLLYTTIFPEKMNVYYQQTTPSISDSINIAADRLISRAAINPLYKKTVINWLTQETDMNGEAVSPAIFTHLVENYHAKDTTLTDLATRERLKYKAQLYKPNLLGKKAPVLILKDENDIPIDLYSIASPYTVVYFFSPLCKHCQEKMPIMKEVMTHFSTKGVKCYAVSVDKEIDYWKKFVKEKPFEAIFVTSSGQDAAQKSYAAYNLPVLFILDKDKKIIGRHIELEKLGEFLSNEQF